MSSEQEITVTVGADERELANPYYELQVYTSSGSDFRLPVTDELCLGGPQSVLNDIGQWTVRLHAVGKDRNVLSVRRADGNLTLKVKGVDLTEAELVAGDCFEVAGHRIWVVDTRLPAQATLEGYSEPYIGRQWPLYCQQYNIGRRGSRTNQIELNHPTISRTQASLIPAGTDQFQLVAETSSSPTLVNGKRLETSAFQTLHHGDLIQMGELQLRFRSASTRSAAGLPLHLFTLGRFEVRFGSHVFPAEQWKTEKSRWLLARIGLDWTVGTPVEQLMEQLWPEAPAVRGRKNLSHVVNNIRQVLGLAGEPDESEDIFLRSHSSIQIQPQSLGEHDYFQALSLAKLRHSSPLNELSLEKALQLYTGEFLPGCYEDWAVDAREHLALEILQTAVQLGQHYLQENKLPAAIRAAQKAISVDPCSQEAYTTLIQAHIQEGRYPEAVRAYEQIKKSLTKEMDMEPNTELMRLYHVARLEI